MVPPPIAQRGTRHAADVIGSLEKDVFPKIGTVPIDAVTPAIVYAVLEAIERRPAIETAHRIRQRTSEVFVYAISRGLREDDSAIIVKSALGAVSRGCLQRSPISCGCGRCCGSPTRHPPPIEGPKKPLDSLARLDV
jgi:hypothetical protein